MATIEIKISFYLLKRLMLASLERWKISSVEQCGRTVNSEQDIAGGNIKGRNSMLRSRIRVEVKKS